MRNTDKSFFLYQLLLPYLPWQVGSPTWGGGFHVVFGVTTNQPSSRSKLWVNIVGKPTEDRNEISNLEEMMMVLEKIKTLVSVDYEFEEDFHHRVVLNFQTSLLGKFLGRVLPLDQIIESLTKLWS